MSVRIRRFTAVSDLPKIWPFGVNLRIKVTRNRFLWPLFAFYFVLNFGRALTFTFFPVYLSASLGLSPVLAGYALGGGLVVATLGGLFLGMLVDRLTPARTLPIVVVISAGIYLVLPLAHRFYQVAILLTLIEITFTTMHLATKSLLAGLLPAERRGAAYSVIYTSINVAFCLAPILGAALGRNSPKVLMQVSAGACFVALAIFLPSVRLYAYRFTTTTPAASGSTAAISAVGVLSRDTRLRWFTLGGFFSALVYARFATWLTQYLGYVTGGADAARLASLIVATNAATVICLQYAIGRRIGYRNMVSSVAIGSGLLVAGLMVYQASLTSLCWVVATVLFSIGEVVIVPSEFLFIDSIAKDGMKGAYFGAQNFAMLGGGLNSIVCGLVLANHHLAPGTLFVLMALFAMTGCAFYTVGMRKKPLEWARTT